MSSALRQGWAGIRLRRRRALLTALGIALAGAMLGAALVVGIGLGNGFDRAARASDLPDIIVRFDPESASRVAGRIAALPDLAAYATRFEATNVGIAAGGQERDDAVAEVLGSGRRGYAVVAGRDLRSRGAEVLVERAFADAWGLKPGSRLFVDGLGPQTIVGLVEAPDNVGFPLAKPRFYVSRAAIDTRFGAERDPRVNVAEIWLRDPRYLNEVLVQARGESFGLHNVRFATRSGVRVLLDQAAGIVIDLLVALSVIALLTAGVMLGASARAEVQRRLGAIGVRRAIGATREHEMLAQGLEALLIAAPAATVGIAAGVIAIYGPANRLLTLLNEPPPGWALAVPLLAGWLARVLIPVVASAWPAWRAGGRPVVALLRGADVSVASGRSSGGSSRLLCLARGSLARGGRAPPRPWSRSGSRRHSYYCCWRSRRRSARWRPTRVRSASATNWSRHCRRRPRRGSGRWPACKRQRHATSSRRPTRSRLARRSTWSAIQATTRRSRRRPGVGPAAPGCGRG